MLTLLQTELLKIKRYHLLWTGVGLMLLSVVMTLFTSTAMDGSVWDFTYLVEQVMKNNMVMTFPVCITLICGYLISREQTDGTLKSLLIIPVSRRHLIGGKLLLGALLSLLFGAASAVFTLLGEWAAAFPGFCFSLAALSFVQLPAQCLLLYLAVLPVITAAARFDGGALGGAVAAFVYGYGTLFAVSVPGLSNWYPPGATLGLLQYRAYDPAVHYNLPACICSLALSVGVSLLLLLTMPEREQQARKK